LNLSEAIVVGDVERDRHVAKAIAVLIEEVEKRTGIHLPLSNSLPEDADRIIVVGTHSGLGALAASVDAPATPGPEGFRITVRTGERDAVFVVGTDARGVLYGVGRLLRNLVLRKDEILLEHDLQITTTPRFPLRGHQLGYRPLNNTYEAWRPEQFDRYIRELALFGANSIELVSPHSDDPQDHAPHMPLPAIEMVAECSRICDDYGLDVSLWYPNVGDDYESEAGIRRELAEREDVFRAIPRLNALFIPGGDPGGLDIDTLFRWSGQVAELLHKHHPRAKLGLSSQAFRADQDWQRRFYAWVQQRPEWLDMIAFAPWERDPLPTLRERVPEDLPIRHYPDITHTFLCQYPVPHWDLAFAMTEGREPICPRPTAMKHIHNLTCEYAVGSLTYSEGVNDDVNKFVWTDQDWDPSTPVEDTLRDYARFFLGPDFTEDVTQGLLALERNWEGPLATNEGVEETLRLWLDLEEKASHELRANWRFQQGLLRACFDASVRRRLLHEAGLERQVLASLRERPNAAALDEARSMLETGQADPVAADLRQRCWELADDLWQGIGAQLSTSRHHGQRTARGAFMDSIDVPLNDSEWLLEEIQRIRAIPAAIEQEKAIRALVGRTDPGPGGFYDSFGDAPSWGRVDPGEGWERDPGRFASPIIGYRAGPKPLAWRNSLTAYYDTPIRISYRTLDPAAAYTLRVTYVGGAWPCHVRLTANDDHLVHEELGLKSGLYLTREYPLPGEVTRNGSLVLTWSTRDGELGARIAELWLCRQL